MLESLGSVPLAFALFFLLLDTRRWPDWNEGSFIWPARHSWSVYQTLVSTPWGGPSASSGKAGRGRDRRPQPGTAGPCGNLGLALPWGPAPSPQPLLATLAVLLPASTSSCPSERNTLPFPQEATFQMYVNNRVRFKSRCKDCFPLPQIILVESWIITL